VNGLRRSFVVIEEPDISIDKKGVITIKNGKFEVRETITLDWITNWAIKRLEKGGKNAISRSSIDN